MKGNEYVSSVLEKVEKVNPGQKEFLDVVT